LLSTDHVYVVWLTNLIIFILQYVNYSSITLKGTGEDDGPPEIENGEIEARINLGILGVPECGQCSNCTEKTKARKLCEKRLELRKRLIEEETNKIYANGKGKHSGKKRKPDKMTQFPNPKKPKMAPAPKKKIPKMMKTANGEVKARVTSQGNKRMGIPDEHFPEFCRRISAQGTGERMNLINQFAEEHPTVSVRQVTLKLGEITTKDMPGCVTAVEREKKVGRAFMFFLRPRFYKYLPADERPEGWETYAEMDEKAWRDEQEERKRKRGMMENAESVSSDKMEMESPSNRSPTASSVADEEGDETDDDEGETTSKRQLLEDEEE
jgi:hypothetical protein